MKFFVRTFCAALAVLCLNIGNAHASVVIGGTRVVFPAAQGEVTVRLTNQGKKPALMEAWIDTGDARSTPDSVHTPFLITPPLFRMDAGKDQSLRIVFVPGDTHLPTDRESLFWLNVLEIPPKPTGEAAHQNTLQFAIRSRLKLFYRPANLPGSSLKAPDKLRFAASTGDAGVVIDVTNPTPYYITISQLVLSVDGRDYTATTGMVAPRDHLVLKVKDLHQAAASGSPIRFTTINDFGGGNDHQTTLQ